MPCLLDHMIGTLSTATKSTDHKDSSNISAGPRHKFQPRGGGSTIQKPVRTKSPGKANTRYKNTLNDSAWNAKNGVCAEEIDRRISTHRCSGYKGRFQTDYFDHSQNFIGEYSTTEKYKLSSVADLKVHLNQSP